MNYRNYIQDLHKDVMQKLTSFFKAEDELALEGNGFIDKIYLDKNMTTSAQSILENSGLPTILFTIACWPTSTAAPAGRRCAVNH
ncbi:MAG: hypothetical protein M3Q58_11260 [Bacteroidota bacterium]|nr:hypothetical protein [Bacteroidota bacterium]